MMPLHSTLGIMTLRIMGLIATLNMNDLMVRLHDRKNCVKLRGFRKQKNIVFKTFCNKRVVVQSKSNFKTGDIFELISIVQLFTLNTNCKLFTNDN
jgi:hypothetical protein